MPNKKWRWTEAMDALQRRRYDATLPGRSQELARGLRLTRADTNGVLPPHRSILRHVQPKRIGPSKETRQCQDRSPT
jgi:hypothetical protein